MKYKCLIVDDELVARQGLVSLCEDIPQLEVIGTCKNGIEAIDHIRSYQPDLVLLDVQMPKIDGFEVLTSMPEPLPQVIFITAHDQYAIKAFEVNAVDYLLKPFSDERFQEAINRAIEKLNHKQSMDTRNLLLDQSFTSKGSSIRDSDEQRLVIKADGNIHLLPKAEIIMVSAYDYYIKVHLKERVFVIRESMKMMEIKLNSPDFLRVHKSAIINRAFVEGMSRRSSGEYEIVLKTGEKVKVSRTKARNTKEWLS